MLECFIKLFKNILYPISQTFYVFTFKSELFSVLYLREMRLCQVQSKENKYINGSEIIGIKVLIF